DGTVVITNAGADLTYEPDPDYCNDAPANPTDDFTYTLAPGGDTATVAVTVTCVADAPDAVGDTATVAEDDPATTIDVLANDSDADGDSFAITSVTQPADGTVVITNAGADLTYEPDPDYCNDAPANPTDDFTYTLAPGGDTATVAVTVTCVSDNPVAADDTATVAEDDPATTIDVLANDSDADGDPFTIGSVTQPADGTVVITNAGADLTYEPDPDYCNDAPVDPTDDFTYTLTPGGDTATVAVSVTCVPDPAVANDNSAILDEDDPAAAINVLANDVEGDTGPISIASVTQPANGTVVITGGGSGLTYQPSPNYCNDPPGTTPDTFTYTLTPDGDTATVSVTVTCVNDAPVADDETFNGPNAAVGNTVLVMNDPTDGAPAESGPKKTVAGDLLAGDTDIDSAGPLTITAETVASVDGGSAVIEADGDFVFTPNPGCTDLSDSFSYTLKDGDGGTDLGTVTVDLSGCVWYVDNSATAGGGGLSSAPFDTLAEAEAASGVNQTIYLYDGDNTTTGYAAGFDLQAGQRLLGEIVDLQIGSDLLATGTPGNRPTITASGADVVTIDDGNTVQGLELDPSGAGGGIAGGAGDSGGGTIADVRIIDAGTAGSQPGLELDGTTGTFNVSDLTVSTAGATGVRLNTAGTVSFAGTGTISVTTSGAKALDLTGTNLGTSVFDSVTVTGSGSGAVAVTNTTGTLTFGDLALTTTSGTAGAFVLSNAAGVTVPAAATTNVSSNGGRAIDVSIAFGAVLNFDSITSTNTTSGVSLTSLGTGTFDADAGTIQGSFQVGSGSGNVTYDGDIVDSTSGSVNVVSRTGGTVSFTGSITDGPDASGGIVVGNNSGGSTVFSGPSTTLDTGNQTAVSMHNSDGHTLQFTGGGLAITTTNGRGFSAETSGTVAVSGSGNTITSTTGRALTIINTDIGAADLTFQSISANQATGGFNQGILLDTTGTLGNLVVTGNGGTCTNADTSGCSGGTIQNAPGNDDGGSVPVGTGIVLKDTMTPSLTRMWIKNHSNYGIRGHNVSGLTIANSVINGANGTNGTDPFNESSVYLTNLTGSASITDTHVSGGIENNLAVVNSTGSLTALTLTNLVFGESTTRPSNDALLLSTEATAGTLNATITQSDFFSAAGDLFQLDHNGSGTSALTLTNNTFDNNHPAIATGGGGLSLFTSGTGGNATMTIDTNTFRDAVGPGVLIVKTLGAATQTATFTNNVIGVSGTANSGSAEGSGLKLQNVGLGTTTWSVTGNQIRGYNNFGVEVLAGGGASAQSGTLNTTITGNTIAEPGTTAGTNTIPKQGVHLNIGTQPGDTFLACTAITGNTLHASGADATVDPTGINVDVRLRQRQATTIRLPGYAGANNDNGAVQTFVINNNSIGGTPQALAANNVPTGGGFVGGAACPTP
ncbi:Ig-like domain-containing protein, partial [Nocardioides pelophilus]|uniref:Ig-like domain-containing protein n=1 Tax=Nocardioides pelophilus TaxID=2172019 RepID=UPI00160277FA